MSSTSSHQVPPGFRFHPTDEELVDYYLRKKVSSKRIDLDVIKEVDLYKIEPWDLQEKCRIGEEEQNEWYFFSHKDKKYPTGTRTNRATVAGFWKATGRDKPIYSKHRLIGMRKTLVFYKGRAPNGQKSDWIMHEYRLETIDNNNNIAAAQEEGWVVCRVFKKRAIVIRRSSDQGSPCWFEDQVVFAVPAYNQQQRMSCKEEIGMNFTLPHDGFYQLPQLESPTVNYHLTQEEPMQQTMPHLTDQAKVAPGVDEKPDWSFNPVTDWRVLDRFVASQLSQEGISEDINYPNPSSMFQVKDK